MTWGRRDGDAGRCPSLPAVCTYAGMDDLTRERYMFMTQANQEVVSPVGAVWRYIRENYPSIELYDADGSHPSAAGSYAAACCFYTALFKEDPNLISYNYTLTPTVAAQIRTAARIVVYNNMETWFLGESESYTLSAISGTGGTISPAGTLTVPANSNISFSISPNTGYEIDDIKIDGISAGAVSNYTFTSVTSNHSISATFKAVIYHTIISSAGIGGSINPVGSVTVRHGSNRTFNIYPDYGYQISNVRIDNNPIGKVSSFSFSNVTEDHTISATFETATYSLAATAGNGGSINPSGNAVVNHGSNRSYTITPSTGYQISDVRVDNSSVGSVIFIYIQQYHRRSFYFSNI